MLITQRSPFILNSILLRSLVAGTLATTGILLGIAPDLSQKTLTAAFQTAALAQQNVSQQEIMNFAKAVLAMEPLRQSAYSDIKRIIGPAPVPNIVCSEPSSFNRLPETARQIAVNFCNRSRDFVTSNGLTTERFNELTRRVQSDADLKRRVQNAMIELQR